MKENRYFDVPHRRVRKQILNVIYQLSVISMELEQKSIPDRSEYDDLMNGLFAGLDELGYHAQQAYYPSAHLAGSGKRKEDVPDSDDSSIPPASSSLVG